MDFDLDIKKKTGKKVDEEAETKTSKDVLGPRLCEELRGHVGGLGPCSHQELQDAVGQSEPCHCVKSGGARFQACGR